MIGKQERTNKKKKDKLEINKKNSLCRRNSPDIGRKVSLYGILVCLGPIHLKQNKKTSSNIVT